MPGQLSRGRGGGMTTIPGETTSTKVGLFSLQDEEEGALGNGLLGALGVSRAAAVMTVVSHRVLASLEDVKLAIRLNRQHQSAPPLACMGTKDSAAHGALMGGVRHGGRVGDGPK